MIQKVLFKIAILCLFFLSSCIDFKGAQSPYSYAPSTSHHEWIPPKGITRIHDDLTKEDVSYLSSSGPLTLGEVIDIALLNSPKTKKTWSMARQAAANYGQSLQKDFILSDAESTFNRSRSAEFTGNKRSIVYESDWGGQLNFSYLILDFGQTRASTTSALEALYNADFTHNREIQTIIQTVMNDYYAYLSGQENVRAAQADVLNAKASFDAVNERLRNGLADLSDRVQAQTSLLQTQLNVVSQKQALVTTYTKLAIDLGVPATAEILLQSYPDEILLFNVASVDTLIEEAIKSRPDVLAAGSDVNAKNSAFLAAKRKCFPSLSSNFDWGRTYYDFNGFQFNDGNDWELSFSLNFPLFQGFFLKNGIKIAQAALEQSEAEYRNLKLTVLQDVVNYRSDVIYAEEALGYAKEFLAAAEEDFRIYLKKYKVGTATILDVIAAQTAVSDARSQFVQSEKNWYTSISNLSYGTGLLSISDPNKLYQLLSEKQGNFNEE